MTNLQLVDNELIRLHEILKSEWATDKDRDFAKKSIEELLYILLQPYVFIPTNSGV